MQSPSEEVQWTVDGGLITPFFEIKTTFNRSAGSEQLTEHVYIYGLELPGDGEIAMRFRPEHRHQHAEASLTIRVDESNWIKTGAEYLGGQHLVSTVTTREHTNWSLSPVDTEADEIWLRLIRAGGTVTVAHADDGVDYTTIASTYLPGGVPVMAGIASARPVSESFWDAAQDLDIDVD
jgi:regulation of enolase protein 1 (concanavalin A-like superfamily)